MLAQRRVSWTSCIRQRATIEREKKYLKSDAIESMLIESDGF
jgi:hypothetical protein